MKKIILLIVLGLSIASCGVRGDPEAPPEPTQAQ